MPKAELHLHLEGSIEPHTVVELAARHGVSLTTEEARARYAFRDFTGFLEAFKWVTSFLRTPADYAVVAERHAGRLLEQNVRYAEITLSAGVMLLRRQDVRANFAVLAEVAARLRPRGLHIQWIFDAVRQFGPATAMEVARLAASLKSEGVVAFGLGGDELSVPTAEFRAVYDLAAAQGLHRVCHAGEIGGPELIREAVDLLGAERIGHGIAAIRDPALMDLLTTRRIPLEVCPTSNFYTGALLRQLRYTEDPREFRDTPCDYILDDALKTPLSDVPSKIDPDALMAVLKKDHPLRAFLRRGVTLTLSTDDPAMFHTALNREYALAARMGLSPAELVRLAEHSFEFSFLLPDEKSTLLADFRFRCAALGLL